MKNVKFFIIRSGKKVKKIKKTEVIKKNQFDKYIHILTKELIENNSNTNSV